MDEVAVVVVLLLLALPCALMIVKLVIVVSRVIDSVATTATAASIDFIVISVEEQIV
jgi:hypothetical protein